ncbi:TIGR01777 family protein [Mucilaginibacter terrenus]|uniref:TIGR01777 family protein n=1 Tax=Mucilaginibacter terrenus TaxID=2482727 RepID=A0A3E2NU96_9SPHI|nr:TIGR01777 family oxidoreductase [Mucilaginibacter terrenus]RFZ84586.1 TIGR01777 family protein [Mucilaginibacter terrenus]
MKYHKIVLAGGNGYLGTVLANYYKPLATEVILLSRKPAATDGNVRTIVWDAVNEGDWTAMLEGADMLINLCGKNVNCRYTEKNKAEIVRSRVVPTTLLGQVIGKLDNPPKVWINLASSTIYRHAEDHAQDEITGEIGTGFSVEVCEQWEKAFFGINTPNTRKVVLRHAIALGRSDGAFPRLLNLAKVGLGGKQGDGEQYVSWIHEHDTARVTAHIFDHPELDGVINCAAPEAIKNKDLMRIIRKAYGIPFGLPAPQWLLEIGMFIIGSETELVLKSRWVAPTRLLQSGYMFTYSKAEHAVHDLLSLRV